MIEYLQENNLLSQKQSAYRCYHSTETAILKVLSAAYAAADGGRVTLLGLLDQSAAFDSVDHRILCDRLKHNFGITGNTLNWICSYLSDRSQFVHYNGIYSKTRKISMAFHKDRSLDHCFSCSTLWIRSKVLKNTVWIHMDTQTIFKSMDMSRQSRLER